MDKELKHGDVVFINVENDFDWTDEGYHYINKKLNNKIGLVVTENMPYYWQFINVRIDEGEYHYFVRPEFITKIGVL
jgi:hypothetical protein